MPDRHRRLEKLEKRASKRSPPRFTNRAVELALQRLSDEHLELLLKQSPGQLDHRDPTEAETRARDAYRGAITEERERHDFERAKPSDGSSDPPRNLESSASPPTGAGKEQPIPETQGDPTSWTN